MINTVKKALLYLFTLGVALGSMNADLSAQTKNDDVSILPADFIKNLNDENFEETIGQGTIVVDFYTEWCQPCKRFAPIFEKVAKQLFTKIDFAKADADKTVNAAKKWKIQAVPTFIIFKDGKEFARKTGPFKDEESFRAFLQPAIENQNQ